MTSETPPDLFSSVRLQRFRHGAACEIILRAWPPQARFKQSSRLISLHFWRSAIASTSQPREATPSHVSGIAAAHPSCSAGSTTSLFCSADNRDNRHYSSIRNLTDHSRTFLFAMIHANQQRINISTRACGEHTYLFKINLLDHNCPLHVPRKVDLAEGEPVVHRRKGRVAELERPLAAARVFE